MNRLQSGILAWATKQTIEDVKHFDRSETQHALCEAGAQTCLVEVQLSSDSGLQVGHFRAGDVEVDESFRILSSGREFHVGNTRSDVQVLE